MVSFSSSMNQSSTLPHFTLRIILSNAGCKGVHFLLWFCVSSFESGNTVSLKPSGVGRCGRPVSNTKITLLLCISLESKMTSSCVISSPCINPYEIQHLESNRPGSQIPRRASPSAAPLALWKGDCGRVGGEKYWRCYSRWAFEGPLCCSWVCSLASPRPQRRVLIVLCTSRRQEEASFVLSNGSFVILP